LLVGANLVQQITTGPGTGYASRVITSPDADILEDKIVSTAGTYSATAQLNGGAWIMQMVAFRAAGSGTGTSPNITSLSPIAGAAGAAVSISGTNFGSSQGTSTITFNGTPAVATAWNSGSITATVPSGATTGNVAVTVNGVASNGVNFTVTSASLSVTVSPKRASVTLSQTQQFTATVSNDPQNGGVSWSVDGVTGGNVTVGTISSTGLFTPGTQPGVHTVSATSNSNPSVSASAMLAVSDLAGVLTYHNDTARTGQNLQEYALTAATVNSSTFGALFTCPVDGYVYAAPLYFANLTIGGQTRNVVFTATEHDTVYAFDADSPSCLQLWKTSFLSPGPSTVPAADTGELNDLVPEIGITSTPVIDPSTNTIYVVPKTKETVGPGCSTNNPCYVHRLHALDITTGAEKLGGPVVLTAPNFVSLYHLQRPALLLSNGTVYIGFGSHGDNNTYQGWLMAYNAATLTQQWVWHSTDPTSGNNEGAIWGSGNGPAADANGNIYVETANGVFDGANNFSDSTVKLSPTGTILDYFTPFDQDVMQQNDIDLGSSGPMILPDVVGSSTHPHLMIATGKVGVVYLLDQTNLGKYNTAANQDLGEVNVGFNTTNLEGGFYGQPAYWNGNIYTVIVGDSLRQYPISNGAISTVSSSNSSNTFTFRGATPAVSASGTTNGIVWVADVTSYQSGGAVILDAYDASHVSSLLYKSPSSGSGAAAPATKFTVPTVANGKVYVGGQFAFTVFGLLPN
jgi:IPT/TIG domain